MKKLTSNDFIKKAKSIHGDKYDYLSVEYKNALTKVKITCSQHGIFEQEPKNHLRGRGCPSCGKTKKSNTKDFIKKAKAMHGDKYNYSLVEYKNALAKVKIICFQHGMFEQIANQHLRGSICPSCSLEIRKTFGYKKIKAS